MAHINDTQDLLNLEKLIDQYDLDNVVDGLITICYEKESHILNNYNDKHQANTWKKSAKILERASAKLTEVGV